jgi:alpha-N-arabinofuranosidase
MMYQMLTAVLVGCALLAVLCEARGQAPGDAAEVRKSIQCHPAGGQRTIDGRLDEWRQETPLAMVEGRAKLWTAWDREHLYVACEGVRAPGPLPVLSLFLDLRPAGQRTASYRRGAYHVKLMVAPAAIDPDVVREQEKTGYWLAQTAGAAERRVIWKEYSWTGVVRTGVVAAASVEPERTAIEARLPWTTFPLLGGGTFQPTPGQQDAFGFDWSVSVQGAGELFWAGWRGNQSDPSRLAAVELLARAEDFSPERFERESTPGPAPAPVPVPVAEEALLLSERPSGFSVTDAPSPTSYAEGQSVSVEILAGESAGYTVSPHIYGQFSEHLAVGWPMVGGVSAQAVVNPSFEPGHPRLDVPTYQQRLLPGRAAELLARWSPQYESREMARRVAPPWVAVGEPSGVSIERNAFNSDQCQRLRAGPEGELGVGQVVRLPIHRERTYRASFHARTTGAAVVTVSLRDTTSVLAEARVPVRDDTWRKYEATLELPDGLPPQINRFLFALTASEGPSVWLEYATLLPADSVDGLCPEVIEVFRELKPGHIRYPGGNFASGYHWRDGIGPREKRPTRLNVAWLGLEPNEVGTDEFLRFCELTGMRAMICVNAGDGTPEEAADWVEYCNGGPETRLGRLRAQNGHPEPYNVLDWDVGNEVWGHWQIGHCPPDEYAARVLRFADAMRRRDPRIRVAVCGHSPFHDVGRDWNRTLCELAGKAFDILTFHTYISPMGPRALPDPAQRLRTILSHPHLYEQSIRDMATRMRRCGIAEPKVAVTEYHLEPNQFPSPRLDRAAHLLWYAQMLHVWMRTGDLLPVCHITEYAPFDIYRRFFGSLWPRYDVFKLYANTAGDRPLRVRVTCPTYDVARGFGPYRRLSAVPIVDAVALAGEDGGKPYVTLGVVNKELQRPVRLSVAVHDFAPAPEATLFAIYDADPGGDPKAIGRLTTEQKAIRVAPTFDYEVPACSVTLLRLAAG